MYVFDILLIYIYIYYCTHIPISLHFNQSTNIIVINISYFQCSDHTHPLIVCARNRPWLVRFDGSGSTAAVGSANEGFGREGFNDAVKQSLSSVRWHIAESPMSAVYEWHLAAGVAKDPL